MDSGGIRVDPIVTGGGGRVSNGKKGSVGSQNIETQARGIQALDISPERVEAIRSALKSAPIDILQKALRDADVQITQYTMDIVKSLVNGSLPLTEHNIVDLLLQSNVFKGAQPDILALMMRLEIPATPENIEQFENLINKGEKLAQNIESLIARLPAEIFRNAGSLQELSFALNEIVKMLKGRPELQQNIRQAQGQPAQANNSQPVQANNNQAQQVQASAGDGQAAVQQGQGAQPVLTRVELNSVLNLLRSLGAPNQVLTRVININRQNAEAAQQPSSQPAQANSQADAQAVRADNAESVLEIISRFVQGTAARVPQDSEFARTFLENIKDMLEGAAVQKLIRAEMQEKWLLTPGELTGGAAEISKYYNELNSNVHRFAQLLQILNNNAPADAAGGAQNMQELYMQARGVQDNLTLMNEISKSMPFLQIPLRLSNGGVKNSDIFIFNNKKKSNVRTVQSVNAMVKLELENLGGIDVHINITGRNARARFFTGSEDSVQAITEHLPELNQAIHALGFNFTSAAAPVEAEEEFDILDDFINREVAKTEIRKYILNMKI